MARGPRHRPREPRAGRGEGVRGARVSIVRSVLGRAGSFEEAHNRAVRFGYGGSNGPDKWGSLSPDYEMCSKGERQSPVNIEKSKLAYNPGLEALERNYVPANATLVNKGYQVGLLFDKNVGTALVDGKNYSLKSVHWHSPSEHTIDGKRYALSSTNDNELGVVLKEDN